MRFIDFYTEHPLLFLGLMSFYVFFYVTIFYFVREENKNQEDYNKTEPFLHLNLIRITLFFAGVGLPLAIYIKNRFETIEVPFENQIIWMNAAFSGLLLLYTFIRKDRISTIKYLLLANYTGVCLSILYCIYLSHINWFYVTAFIIIISLSTSFLNSIKGILYFSIPLTAGSFLIAYSVEAPELHPVLFLFSICCVLFASLILYIKNYQRISFSESILNSTKAFVIVSNRKGEILFVNEAFKEAMGYTDDEILGEGWWKIRRAIEGGIQTREKLAEGTIEKSSVVLLESKHGKRIWIQWENNITNDGSTVAIGADITEKQEKERQFRHIVENAKDIIYTTNENGKFTYVNEIAIMATGYSAEEFSEMDFKQLIHPDYYRKVIEHNLSELKKNQLETYVEFPVIKKSGEEMWLGQQIIFKINSKTQRFSGSQAICRDITERIRTENKLNNYYNDLKTNYELKQSILGAKTMQALAEVVLTKLINNSKITQFITLNLIQEKQFHVYYIDVFSKQIRENYAELTIELHNTIHWITAKNYQSFHHQQEVNNLYLLQQPKFAKNALIHEFKDNNEIIGFIGLYTDFEFDYEKHDTHFISDIANYIKTYIIEIEKNKIIEKKNKEIKDYSKQLESANESLATRNRFQEMVIQSNSFDDLNDTILKFLIADSSHAKTYVFNYLNHKSNELTSYYINKNNTFTFRNKLKLNSSQSSILLSLENQLLFKEKHDDLVTLANLEKIQQPVTNIASAIVAVIKPKHINNGFIGVYSHKHKIYDIHDLNFTIEIANVMQIALTQFENKLLIDEKSSEIEAQNKNLAVLNEAQNTLINNITVEEVFNDLLELLFKKLANIDRASVLKFDFDKKIALLHHISVRHPFVRKKDLTFDHLFILESFIENGIYDYADFDLKPELIEDEKKWYYSGIRSAYAIPIHINNKIYASINLFSNVPGNFNELKNTINQIVSSTQLIIDQLINKSIISEKNKNISANINYAKRIQDAFLPNEDNLKKVFNRSFALLLQRDALGGDFYWVREHESYSLIAVGDCTGHGVSGALLSILSTTYLNTIIEKYQNYQPGIILDFLSSSIYNAFHQKNTETDVNDGLDISFCAYHKSKRKLLFSGAMQTIYITRQGSVIEQKGNRKPIGLENKNLKGNYDTIELDVLPGDTIYMTSDGAIDQFSSTTEKRLGNKRFKEILLVLETLPLKDRKRQLLKELNAWRGNAQQTDDICVVSFEID